LIEKSIILKKIQYGLLFPVSRKILYERALFIEITATNCHLKGMLSIAPDQIN